MPLTDATCKNARCPEGRAYQRLTDGGGLYLEVTATGAKCWRWKYRFAGKEKRLALGQYPTVALAVARRERDKARALLAEGTDPGQAKQDAKRAVLADADTAFESVARRWWNDWKGDKTERYAGYVIARLEADAFPELGHKPIGELTAPDFVKMAKKIEARGKVELPRRVLEVCGQVMRYAVLQGYAERNPVADIKPADVLKSRKAVNHARVGVQELPELMRKLMAYEGSTLTRFALQLMALTWVRTNELIGARWQEFDLEAGEWLIPAERTKKRRQHLVPLSHQALEVLGYLQAARGADQCTGPALLFPGERDHATPMSNNTMLFALRRMGYRGRMTGHGFRGVASTALNEMGFRSDVIEAQLAHVQADKVRAAYNHAQYWDERRELMQAWADYLDAVKRGGKVIPFRQGRAIQAAA